ncbi:MULTISPECIES: polysaccharide pyruvyl transferase family protein [Hyphomonas]|jgi:hypothetical protein|uniref:polysaccharide pyruvyl transferase family protein n=1 Tax=Hyphomonas TaxID=85 RepID=UPI003518826C
MRIALFNDTGNSPHVGCQAVSNAHAVMLGRAGHRVVFRGFVLQYRQFRKDTEAESIAAALAHEGLQAALADCDAVIVNGEGTIHHDAGMHLLAILGAAQALGKVTLLVNAVFEETAGYDDVLARLDDFTVRDQRSLHHARERGLPCRLVWDSALAAEYDPAPLFDLKGATAVTDWHFARADDTGRTSLEFLRAHPEATRFLPLASANAHEIWSRYPATLATASQIVTGRHHGCYFAIKARRRFIPLGSNTHKIEGLLDAAGASIPIPRTLDDLEDALRWAESSGDMYDRLFDLADTQLPLSTFERLGTGTDSDEATELSTLSKQAAKVRRRARKRHGESLVAEERLLKAALMLNV